MYKRQLQAIAMHRVPVKAHNLTLPQRPFSRVLMDRKNSRILFSQRFGDEQISADALICLHVVFNQAAQVRPFVGFRKHADAGRCV